MPACHHPLSTQLSRKLVVRLSDIDQYEGHLDSRKIDNAASVALRMAPCKKTGMIVARFSMPCSRASFALYVMRVYRRNPRRID